MTINDLHRRLLHWINNSISYKGDDGRIVAEFPSQSGLYGDNRYTIEFHSYVAGPCTNYRYSAKTLEELEAKTELLVNLIEKWEENMDNESYEEELHSRILELLDKERCKYI